MSIDRAAYSDPSVFDEEMTRLFGARMYVGSIFDLSATNDYRSFQVGNRAITIRNTPEGIRAFNNVCLHRNALIDPPGSGNRPFRCGYHGWSYGDDGALKHAPLADGSAICNRQLTEYPVAQVEGLCFLGLQEPPDISDIEQALHEAAIVPAIPFHEDVLDHACNWKLLVENVLEGYHLSHVHTNTFIPAGFTSTGHYDCHASGDVSWAKLSPAPKNDRSGALQRLSKDVGHFYWHVHVFPDLFLSNTNGLIGFQSNLIPTDAANTRLEWSLFELPALMRLSAPVREQMKGEAIKFSRAALAEDKMLVELCQLGLESKGEVFQLQPRESRLSQFHGLYQEKMGHAFR